MAPSLTVTDYIDEFLNGDAKSAVKRMTKELETRLRSVTINAKDWYALPFILIFSKIVDGQEILQRSADGSRTSIRGRACHTAQTISTAATGVSSLLCHIA